MAEDQSPGPMEPGTTGKAGRAKAWLYANRRHWMRGLLMVAFFFVLGLVKLLIGLMALFQLGSLLLTGQPIRQLRRLGSSLALYIGDLVAYLTCVTDDPPFPFSEWPRANLPE